MHKNKTTLLSYDLILEEEFIPHNLLEIGAKEGGSLVLWREIFGPTTNILGLDINLLQLSEAYHAYTLVDWGVKVLAADVTKPGATEQKVAEFASGFDLIVDDGPHTMPEIPGTFSWAWPMVRKGGIYVIEDWQALHPIHQKELKEFLTYWTNGMDYQVYPNMIVLRMT
jgi:cephalosporin hydroxylase